MMNKAGAKKENRLVKAFKATKSEFKKIVWPTWKQVAKNTMIVIADGKVRTIGTKDEVFPALMGEFSENCGFRGKEAGANE